MRILSVFVIILIILSACSNGYQTLEEAVQSHWKTPIKVINEDRENQLVYYLDQNQHVLGVYELNDNKYKYDNEQSVGMTFTSEAGLPFLVSANHFEGVGNVIHGAITTDEHTVEKFVLHYKNGETQEVDATNNTFITEYPPFLTKDPVLFFEEMENAVGYDVNGEIIEIWDRNAEIKN
ncbi:hypothetical protein LG307_21355 [Sutcliffiella horikoshii]|uniref:hypothetical protein n=1 Tax=Sutcliffiella horikoshii TaxID=79883 RepID=UPI00384ABA4F